MNSWACWNSYPSRNLAITLISLSLHIYAWWIIFSYGGSSSDYLMEDNGKTGFALEKDLIIYLMEQSKAISWSDIKKC